ncbi:MAG: hypothetical protein V4510_00455 [bacterium]
MSRVLVVAMLACLAAVPVTQAESSVTLRVTAHDGGSESWFEVEGYSGRNPELHVDPGASVTIILDNNGSNPHGFTVGVLGGVKCCVAPGATGTGQFIAPVSDTALTYNCPIHDLMRGTIVVGAGSDKGTPLPVWILPVALALALTIRKPFGARLRRQGQ